MARTNTVEGADYFGDPFHRINGAPPPGFTWTLVEHPTNGHLWNPPEGSGAFSVCTVVGPPDEEPKAKKARLLREAAELIRRGTQLNSSVGSKDLRDGLIRIADALEVE